MVTEKWESSSRHNWHTSVCDRNFRVVALRLTKKSCRAQGSIGFYEKGYGLLLGVTPIQSSIGEKFAIFVGRILLQKIWVQKCWLIIQKSHGPCQLYANPSIELNRKTKTIAKVCNRSAEKNQTYFWCPGQFQHQSLNLQNLKIAHLVLIVKILHRAQHSG